MIDKYGYTEDYTFPVREEPVLDCRKWFHAKYARLGMQWSGPEPEEFSPLTLSEEERFCEDVLEGSRKPRTIYETQWLKDVGGLAPKAKRPTRWVQCKKCESEFQARGYPIGLATKTGKEPAATLLSREAIPAVRQVTSTDGQWRVWIYPDACEICSSRVDAFIVGPHQVGGQKTHKTPTKDRKDLD